MALSKTRKQIGTLRGRLRVCLLITLLELHLLILFVIQLLLLVLMNLQVLCNLRIGSTLPDVSEEGWQIDTHHVDPQVILRSDSRVLTNALN